MTKPASGVYPTLTAPIGPFQGMLEKAKEAEAVFKATTSGKLDPSMANKLATT